MEKAFLIKVVRRLVDGIEDVRELRVLERVIRWTPHGYQADPRHAEILWRGAKGACSQSDAIGIEQGDSDASGPGTVHGLCLVCVCCASHRHHEKGSPARLGQPCCIGVCHPLVFCSTEHRHHRKGVQRVWASPCARRSSGQKARGVVSRSVPSPL